MLKLMKNKGIMVVIITLMLVIVLGVINVVYGNEIEVEGVYQGTNGSTFAKDAQIVNIYIDESKVATKDARNNAICELLTTTKGFDKGRSAGDVGTNFVVFSRGQAVGAGNNIKSGQDNYFDGDIAKFTFKDAAVLEDGSTADVEVIYSNLHIVLQSNVNETAGNSNGTFEKSTILSLFSGNMVYIWSTIGKYSENQRYGIKVDVNVRVTKNGNLVDGNFYYPMIDIDVNRRTQNSFSTLWGASENNNYSESVTLKSGFVANSNGDAFFIPDSAGVNDGGTNIGYKCEVSKSSDGLYTFLPTDNDTVNNQNGSFYSGFVTVANNTAGGINFTMTSAGAKDASVKTLLLYGLDATGKQIWHRIKSSTGVGGTIKTTKDGNLSADLNDGSDVISSTTIVLANGKTVIYNIDPKQGYRLKEVIVDGKIIKSNSFPKLENDEIEVEISDSKKGILKNIGNGKYTFTFPENNADHKIHVDWDADHYFIKEWNPEDVNILALTAKAYTFDGTKFVSAGINDVTFTVNKTDSNVTVTGKTWKIKKTDLPIEIATSHDSDHDVPLYWFIEETVPSGYTLEGYSNSSVTSTGYYDDASKNVAWQSAVRGTISGAYASIVESGGKITNIVYRDLTVTKQVTGNMADITKSFTYTIKVGDGSTPANLTISKNDGDDTIISNGGNFTLTHGDTVVVKNIIKGSTYTLTETDTEDYTESYKINDEANITIDNKIENRNLNDDETVTFINNKDESVLTGSFTDNNPFVILILISGTTIVLIYVLNRGVLRVNVGRITKKGKRMK